MNRPIKKFWSRKEVKIVMIFLYPVEGSVGAKPAHRMH
jgi:hypothetical protein